MPPTEPVRPEKSLEQVVAEVGLYPKDAFLFVEEGLSYTVRKIHGKEKKPDSSRHGPAVTPGHWLGQGPAVE